MLKQRLITALVLIPLVVSGILFLPTSIIALLFGAVLLLAAWEWANLSGLQAVTGRLVYLAVIVAGMMAVWRWLYQSDAMWWLIGLAALWWCGALVRLVTYRGVESPTTRPSGVKAVSGLLVLVSCWAALVALHALDPGGPALVLALMVIIWFADAGAYFAGRQWGKSPLAPKISPGKTLEGVYGAAIAVALLAVALAWLWLPPHLLVTGFLLTSFVTFVFSIAGDLWESTMKRERGVKDSGKLLPGHGGILDRIDSLTSTSPVFLIGILLSTQS